MLAELNDLEERLTFCVPPRANELTVVVVMVPPSGRTSLLPSMRHQVSLEKTSVTENTPHQVHEDMKLLP